MSQVLLDAAGRRRSPATLPGFHAGRPPCNKGRRYPADPPTIEEIVAVMRHAGNGLHGHRLRGLIVVLWIVIQRQLGHTSLGVTSIYELSCRSSSPRRSELDVGRDARCHGWA